MDMQKSKLETDLRSALLKESQAKTADEIEQQTYGSICYLLDNFDCIDYKGKNELIKKTVKKCIFDGTNLRIIF